MQKKTDNNKCRYSVKTAARECFNIIKNTNAKLVSTLVAIVILLTSFGIITNYYTIAYDVYYGDVNVGVITSKEDAFEAYNEAQTDVIECSGDNLEYDLEFVMTIAPVAKVESSDIYRGIVVAAEGEETCYSIQAGNTCVAKLKTQEEAGAAVRKHVESYGELGGWVSSEYSIVQTTGIVTELSTVDEAAIKIKESNLMPVMYIDVYRADLVIEYDEIVVEDESLASGLRAIKQFGSDGYGYEKGSVVYENGVAVQTNLPEVVITREPVDQIVHVGTGSMVGLTEKSLPWPTKGTFTSEYGYRWGRNHNGVDIGAPTGTPIYAPCSGKVTFSSTKNGYGNYVMIDHGNGFVSTYAHMNERRVVEGQIVNVGDMIGTVGMTGRVTGPHLHFEILHNGSYVNPMNYIAG